MEIEVSILYEINKERPISRPCPSNRILSVCLYAKQNQRLSLLSDFYKLRHRSMLSCRGGAIFVKINVVKSSFRMRYQV